MNQIIIRESHWQELTKYLLNGQDEESGVYAVFKTSVGDDLRKFLVTQIMIPNDVDYLGRTSVRVAFTPEFTEKAFQQCEKAGGHLLDIHTHPWSTDVEFSSIDDREAEHTKVPYLTKYLPETMIGFVVFGSSDTIVRARFWDKTANRLVDIDRIMVI